MPTRQKQIWRYVRGLAAPVLLWTLFVVVLIRPLQSWLQGDDWYDAGTMHEWIEETRIFHDTLPQLTRDFLTELDQSRASCTSAPHWSDRADSLPDYLEALTQAGADPTRIIQLRLQAERLHEHLKSMGNPLLANSGQLPSFPVIYRLAVLMEVEPGAPPLAIVWDSKQTRHASQFQKLDHPVSSRAWVNIQYQLHAYNKRQQIEQAGAQRVRWVGVLAVAGTVVALLWIFLVQHRERDHERQRIQARQQLDEAEHKRLEEELRRRQVEQRQEETERKLLEQTIATQAAERQALELKSQLYASIGIMAGSYAHNIKNLLVRPNDLLRRCLAVDGLSPDQEYMLREVRHTLGTVTERLQQILRTVRRDPSRSELSVLDLNRVTRELQQTWEELAREKWKLVLMAELGPEPLWIKADLSHLQQAVENLLFNARDATFEMRSHLRDEARHKMDVEPHQRREALISAAGWRGSVVLRTRRAGDFAILEVQDNGIGMTETVKRRCTETHFTTKRDNAIYEGNNTGMGLGLSFVAVIVEHHQATLEISSEPLQGALFRVSFPLTAAPVVPPADA